MAKDVSRRTFVAGGAGALAVGASLAGAALADEAGTAQGEAEGAYDYTADVVIAGSGMGGMCAGVQALQDGAQSVVIVEISKWTGGGTSFAYGAIHGGSGGKTLDTFDAFTEYGNTGELAHAVYSGFEPLLHWVAEDLQLPVDADYDTPFGRMLNADGEGNPTAPRHFFDKFAELFESMGGRILTETRATHVIMDEDRARAIGLQCEDKDGNVVKIGAQAVILACGGWQNNSELRARYLGVDGHQAKCMGTPYNTGAGLMMAVEAGAGLQGAMGQWAGCFVAADPAKNWMEDPAAYEEYGYDAQTGGKWWLYNTVIDTMDAGNIWVNADGLRFVDENLPGISSKHAVARQPHAACLVVCDATVWDEWMAMPPASYAASVQEQIDIITSDAVGGRVFSADSIEGLADALNESGIATCRVHKANFMKTVEEYNAAAEAGTGADLYPPKASSCTPLVTPPFYALPIQAAPYANYGGVAIDANAQVLDLSRRPIPGLYATVPCAGGAFNEFYTGTIAAAGATGRMAASAAMRAIGGADEA